MKDAMITFGKDYMNLMKHSIEFTKDHWVGLLAITAVTFAVEFAVLNTEFKKMDSEVDAKVSAVKDGLTRDTEDAIARIKSLVNGES